ncbi:sulfotransferase domain-containing protein [Zavarzinia sp. CC-PAN008]|uniref:sulfotransferase domain-containing protein n=1 Tax=Zavarzinia sp. CC-PAN008 TaxID=3243332 RepID=UPI003F746437
MQRLRSAIREQLEHWRARSVLPRPVDHADLFLVDFPRSGVTFLSYLLANALLLRAGDERRATFFNVEDFVPDIHTRTRLGPPALAGLGHRLLKSHATFTPAYKKLIYLVRDPRHVLPSYHVFLTQLGQFAGPIEALVEDRRFGIDAWCAHVEGWLDRTPPSVAMMLLRYEDLAADPAGELGHCLRALGWAPDAALLAAAAERCTLAAMRADEAAFNARHPATGGLAFVRPATAGPAPDGATTARVTLPPAVARQVVARAGPLLRRLGYSTD